MIEQIVGVGSFLVLMGFLIWVPLIENEANWRDR